MGQLTKALERTDREKLIKDLTVCYCVQLNEETEVLLYDVETTYCKMREMWNIFRVAKIENLLESFSSLFLTYFLSFSFSLPVSSQSIRML